jgi:hypothetical protein
MFNIKQKLRKWLFEEELYKIKMLDHRVDHIDYVIDTHTVSLSKHEKDILKLYKYENLELEPDRTVYTMAASTSPLDIIKTY